MILGDRLYQCPFPCLRGYSLRLQHSCLQGSARHRVPSHPRQSRRQRASPWTTSRAHPHQKPLIHPPHTPGRPIFIVAVCLLADAMVCSRHLGPLIHERDRQDVCDSRESSVGRRSCSEITQVARVVGAERMDLRYLEGCGTLHSGVRVFLRRLA